MMAEKGTLCGLSLDLRKWGNGKNHAPAPTAASEVLYKRSSGAAPRLEGDCRFSGGALKTHPKVHWFTKRTAKTVYDPTEKCDLLLQKTIKHTIKGQRRMGQSLEETRTKLPESSPRESTGHA